MTAIAGLLTSSPTLYQCDTCADLILPRSTYAVGRVHICEACWDKGQCRIVQCDRCGTLLASRDVRVVDDDRLCAECAEETEE